MWLIFSDLHLDEWKAFATITSSGFNSRLMQQVEVVKEIKKIARKKNINNIFFLGDLFNSLTANVPKLLYNLAYYLVKSLAEVAHVYLLVGNHDNYKGVHMFTPFESIPNVTVIHTVTSITVDGHTIDFVPWLENPPEKKSEYCFGHFGISGATVSNGLVVEADELDAKLLTGYNLVLAGHYHTRQMVGKNVYQVGGVMANSFKDSEEDKGIWFLDPVTEKLDFLPIKSPKFHIRQVTFSDELEAFIAEVNSKDYWKLVVKSDGLIVPSMPPNVIIEYDYDPRSLDEIPVDTSSISNLVPIIQEFIDKSNTALSKDILKTKAIELLEV